MHLEDFARFPLKALLVVIFLQYRHCIGNRTAVRIKVNRSSDCLPLPLHNKGLLETNFQVYHYCSQERQSSSSVHRTVHKSQDFAKQICLQISFYWKGNKRISQRCSEKMRLIRYRGQEEPSQTWWLTIG